MILSALPQNSHAQELSLPFNQTTQERIFKGEVFTKADVENISAEKKQTLFFAIAALHKKSCTEAMVKLSQYENYKDFLPFVSESNYSESSQILDFLVTSSILPFNFRLNFKIPRIKKEGDYTFTFDKGFLTGLLGIIHLRPYKDHCLFFIEANWQGPDTGMNATLLELFMKTSAQLGAEKLFRISSN